jgi:hypothetical protein
MNKRIAKVIIPAMNKNHNKFKNVSHKNEKQPCGSSVGVLYAGSTHSPQFIHFFASSGISLRQNGQSIVPP